MSVLPGGRGRLKGYLRLLVLVAGKAGAGGINLLGFLVMAAAVGSDDLSAYAICVSIMSVLSAPSESSEFAYVRAVAGSASINHALVAIHMVRAKMMTLTACVVVAVVAVVLSGFSVAGFPRWLEILPWVCLQSIVTLAFGLHTTWLAGMDQQVRFTRANVFNALATLISASGLWLLPASISTYLLLNVALTSLVLAHACRGRYRAIAHIWVRSLSRGGDGHARFQRSLETYRPYFRSVMGTTVLSIVKNNSLILVMGQQGNDRALAVFIVAKRVFDFLHKGMGGFLEQLYVSLSKMADRGAGELEAGIVRLFALRGVMAVIASAMLLAYFKYMDVGLTKNTAMVLSSVLLSFLVMYFMTIATLMLSKYDPRGLFVSSAYTAVIHGVVPIAFAKFGTVSSTPLAHVLCSVLSSLPLCALTFSRFDLTRARALYGITVMLSMVCFGWLVSQGVHG